VDDGVAEHSVAAQRSVIRLIVADDETGIGRESLDEQARRTVVPVPQHTHMPGPHETLQRWREGMDREDEGRDAGSPGDRGNQRGYGVMIGAVEPVQPAFALL